MIDNQKQKMVVGDGSKCRRGRSPGSKNHVINASSSSNQLKTLKVEQGASLTESQQGTGEVIKKKSSSTTKYVGEAVDMEGSGVPVTHVRKKRTCKKEDVCFTCKEEDDGSLLSCNRPMCPKAYHYDCMHHDDQLPMQKDRPSCGWHFCSFCDKAAQSMCYTCTFSVCRLCIKQAKFVCVKGNKGLCETCMEFILLIETDEQGNTNLVRKSFDEKNSLENLFKVYWKALQGRISLTSDEITRAKNMLKESRENYQTRRDGAVDKEQTELIFPGKGLPSIVPTNSTNAPEQFRCISGEGSCSTEHDCVDESSLNLENVVDASNGDAVVGSGSFPESAVVDLGDEEEIWHRRDESGQIKGPFSMAQLDYWCTKHHFRANLRIWRATEKEEDSILLMDALNGNFPKELPQLKTCLTDASAFSNNKIISSKSDDAVLSPGVAR